MTKLRFSLRWVIALVTIAAVGCAALANPTDLTASFVSSGTFVIIACSVVFAFKRQTAAAVVFSLCGVAYLGILAPGGESNISLDVPTERALQFLDVRLYGYPASPFSPFQRIGHCLLALLFAAIGGFLAGWLGTRERNGDAC